MVFSDDAVWKPHASLAKGILVLHFIPIFVKQN
jgi:hypothetical protein